MANQIGIIPEFTEDESVNSGIQEVKESTPEQVVEQEKETPAESSAVEKPAEEVQKPRGDDIEVQVQALQQERTKLLKEIQDLRGTRRELKKEDLLKVESKIDELKDLHPEDVTLIQRILNAKGYVTKEDANKMFYESVKQDELNKFLEKYPEYKPENDPNDLNWNSLQRELGYYRLPDNPHQIGEVLEKAHKVIGNLHRTFDDRGVSAKQKQIELARVGSGNTQRSSSKQSKSLNSRHREELERGGWSEEEIKQIENSL